MPRKIGSSEQEPAPWPGPVRAALQRRLLDWFARYRRPLPWRTSRDPYRIWVSEVMLQQTTTAAVIPYYERFLAAFPTVEALAQAEEEDVLRLWQGLGYYRRARHLHAAARTLVQHHGGRLPDDPDLWRSLPGVGRYICAAVLSQAFDRPLPIVEANSLRVLARLYGYRGDPRQGAGQRWVWRAAQALLPTQRVGDFNQALMELGSLVCTPRQPRCAECPWQRWCRARQLGEQERIPPPASRPVPVEVQELAVLIRRGSRWLLCQRPATANRWPRLWEVPHAEIAPANDARAQLPEVVRQLTALEVQAEQPLTTLCHSVTRFRIHLHAWSARYLRGTFASSFYTAAVWVTPQELDRFPLSSPQRRLLEKQAAQATNPKPEET
ncbi:MAG: A/G-specific adenine glycosylase [Gemmataceae bacterium]|jgi:A/G-specific adenine glycosylase|nr:MAG: A/G-specific adenine glycosylase [Gemmataceae bacterium]